MKEITMTFNAEITMVKKDPPEYYELADNELIRANAEKALKTVLCLDDVHVSDLKVFLHDDEVQE